MKVKSESEVAQSYLTLSDPMDCSQPGSSVHGIFQARVLEWVAIAFSVLEGSSQSNKAKKKKSIQITKEEIKLSVFVEDFYIIFYVEILWNP